MIVWYHPEQVQHLTAPQMDHGFSCNNQARCEHLTCTLFSSLRVSARPCAAARSGDQWNMRVTSEGDRKKDNGNESGRSKITCEWKHIGRRQQMQTYFRNGNDSMLPIGMIKLAFITREIGLVQGTCVMHYAKKICT